MTKYFRLDEVAQHNKIRDMWLIIDRRVFDVSKFAEEHPGGWDVFTEVAGGDASNGFKSIGHSDSAKEDMEKYCIGDIHPDDAGKLRESFQGTQSSPIYIAVVMALFAISILIVLSAIF